MSYDGMPAQHHVYQSQQNTQTTIDRNQYDEDIHQIVDNFNNYLSQKYSGTGYQKLDWRLVKAMMWVESGHQQIAWQSRPMQIGNEGDVGLRALLYIKKKKLKNGKVVIQSEGAEYIIPPQYAKNLTIKNETYIRFNPKVNIQAGVAYLLMRHAKFGYEYIKENDSKEYSVTVKLGDTFSKIAHSHHTTVATLKALNPEKDHNSLLIGSQLKYIKVKKVKTIRGWYPINFASVARKYNAFGDYKYRQKLSFEFAQITNK